MKHVILCSIVAVIVTCTSTKQPDDIHIRWQIQSSGTDASLRGLCAMSDRIAWASGSGGTILRTTDGGKFWQGLPSPDIAALDFRDIQAFDENKALILSAGQPARIYKTTDGGNVWTNAYTDPNTASFYNAMAFWDEKNGIATSDPVEDRFLLIRTTDGGHSWGRVPPENIPEPLEGEAGFAASGTCIAVWGETHAWLGMGGLAARLFRSTDRGWTWSAASTPVLRGRPSAGIFSIAFLNSKNGVIVGGDYQDPDGTEGNAAYTTDGGMTWLPADASPPSGYRSCVAFLPGTASALLAVGPNGSDLSVDYGKIWTRLDTIGYHVASFPRAGNTGWAAGGQGRIAKIIIE
jgi:photosystem II stability/assembly factor-like uncharacterized protein